MTAPNHEQTRYYLHVGHQELTGAERRAVDEHLAVCAECRAYSTELASLQDTLSRVMGTRWNAIHRSVDIETRIKVLGRRKIMQRQMLQFTGSLASTAILVALVAAIVWVFQPGQLAFTPGSQPPAKATADLQPQHPVKRLFSGEIMLLGFTQSSKDSTTNLRFLWYTVKTPSHDYAAFVHVLSPEGNLLAQIDHPLMSGSRTSQWKPDEIAVDEYELNNQALPTGACTLRVGLYRPDTGERLLTDENRDAVDLNICEAGR